MRLLLLLLLSFGTVAEEEQNDKVTLFELLVEDKRMFFECRVVGEAGPYGVSRLFCAAWVENYLKEEKEDDNRR